jgi:hypothetical protein
LGLEFEKLEKNKCELTNFSHNSRENDLFLPGCLDSGSEIGIVPCIDLALTVDERGSWMHLFGHFQAFKNKIDLTSMISFGNAPLGPTLF